MSVRNVEQYVAEGIESILTQTFKDFEFLIINDGSTDSTQHILSRYASCDPRIMFFNQEHLGLIHAQNFGCDHATGKYIARMDGDDIAFRERFERQVELLERHPTVGLLGGAMQVIRHDGTQLTNIGFPCLNEDIKSRLSDSNCFAHNTIMMRKEVIDAVGGYRPPVLHAEDYDLWLRVSEVCDVANLPDLLVQYRMHPAQVTVRNLEQQAISAIGARTAAEVRRRTGVDPLDNVSLVTLQLLWELGIDKDKVDSTVLHHYFALANMVSAAGTEDSALSILKGALAYCRSAKASTAETSSVYTRIARLYYKQGRTLQSLSAALHACLCEPQRPMRWLLRQLMLPKAAPCA